MATKIDFASRHAAKFACQNWHYSQTMPVSGVNFGIWQNGTFAGAVLFGFGAGSSTNGKKYGLAKSHDIAELTRVALKSGHEWPVSKIVSICVKMLKKQSPNLHGLISFADPRQGHHGGIYQAMNWLYTGETAGDKEYIVFGKKYHPRSISSRKWKQSENWLKQNVDPNAKRILTPGKHRYILPWSEHLRDSVQPFILPYPKRVKQAMGGDQPPQQRGSTDSHAPTPLSEAAA